MISLQKQADVCNPPTSAMQLLLEDSNVPCDIEHN